jgi:subtilisin family serine protease
VTTAQSPADTPWPGRASAPARLYNPRPQRLTELLALHNPYHMNTAGFPLRRVPKKVRAARPFLSLEPLEDRCLLSTDPLLAMHVPVPSPPTGEESYDTSHILVRFHPDVAGSAASAVLGGTELGEAFVGVPGLYEVRLAAGVNVATAVAAYQASPAVVYAEPDYRIRPRQVPDDEGFSEGFLWGLYNTGQSGGATGADIHAPQAWDVTTGSQDVVVAVLDTGADVTHPDLAANVWTNPGEIPGNGIDDDHNGFVDDVHGYDFVHNSGDPADDAGHGTHVAGVIGAVGNNGRGVAGVSWHVRIMDLKIMDASGSSSMSDAIRALNYAVAMGARVSNNSWSGWDHDPAFYDALRNGRDHGHLFVAAAGNDNRDNDLSPGSVECDRLDNVISVAATDAHDAMASFSNWGATSVDLAAPGVAIMSTLPGGQYGTESGTSMAAPYVTGAAALLWAADPSLTAAEVKQRLLGGVDPVGQVAGNAAKPTRTNGRLNVANSLRTDLSWDAIVAPAGTVSEGQDFTVSREYRVSGSAAGPDFTIAYYGSRDPVFGNADDVLLGTETIRAAADKVVGRHAATSPVLRGVPAGTAYVFARLDDGDAVTEFDETNQISAPASFTVTFRDVGQASQRYVAAVYLDVLGRPVDPSGLAHWSRLLDGGLPRAQVVQVLTHSEEYGTKVVRDAYHKILGRAPDDAGLTAWVRQLEAGLTDAQLAAAFLGSAEFYGAAGGTDQAWVQALYRVDLGRAADPSGASHWAQRLADGASRTEIALGVTASAEHAARVVEACYTMYLGRTAGPAEIDGWVAALQHGLSTEDLVAGFAGSEEYFRRKTNLS